MQESKKLTKNEMKKILGATSITTPNKPAGNYAFLSVDDGGHGYMCCWNANPTVCSSCVPEAQSNWSCGSDSSLTAC